MKVKIFWLVRVVCAVVVCGAMVSAVSAGVFDMGGTRNADGSWTGLASLEMVNVGNPGNANVILSGSGTYGAVNYSYRISKYEVTAAQYTTFLNAVAATDTYGLYVSGMWFGSRGCKIQQSGTSGNYAYSVASDYANRPVNYVSWANSARFVNWLHNGQPTGAQSLNTTEDGAYYLNGVTSYYQLRYVTRKADARWAIPTEDEWFKAAYHKNDGVTGNYFSYPTSSDAIPSNDLVTPDGGNNANYFNPYTSDYTIGSPYYRTEVGAFENSSSPYGTFDQGGNVWEWTEKQDSYARYLRGGSFDDERGYLLSKNHTSYAADAGMNDFGIRVVAIPEPATMSLLALGVVGMLRRRR